MITLLKEFDVKVYYNTLTGEYRWNIKSRNWKIIWASSEWYKNKKDCISNLYLLAKAIAEYIKE